ncbi:MAG: hypothetical protein M1826_004053 [Phylliscum demangeonii]|nr:MAG: hypothetical protein M1826_004053 [Phylliscum demangeonii]
MPDPLPSSAPPTAVRLLTLYGLIIAHSSVVLVTLNAATAREPPRCIATLDHRGCGHDVWNALAIAICVCRARDWMVAHAKQLGGAFDDTTSGGDGDDDDDDVGGAYDGGRVLLASGAIVVAGRLH